MIPLDQGATVGGVLYLALSCLQGRPQQQAAEDLLALGPDGLQLTPGCVPTSAFAAWVAWRGVPVRTHDGFAWTAYRRDVWAIGEFADSVHPPIGSGLEWMARVPEGVWRSR